ncbi:MULTISPECIES: pyroglutamyl-peptidase I [Actinotignum]|uniref:Pyrrolidone-carboxylate peptidase n=1 Tax=Actinotignum timonense TaxID=1870995 RepID=A0AAW9H9P5_9ACTO|nr:MULTISPECIES: pyroglutamyl-peptidase I [Actinotignum]MBS5749147.1 pyroglutamyl-peptidase I [Actinotignum schaalii]MDE1558491.1 pyroglutamyl-peptidase I [Actinotignum schaalii]MDE1662748.1 pyroglutamyl-peptidase I [Actinotignum schaalii]MDK6372626.1 pyroglutamyl-peptidase I [Actinotignum timonense]MDK6418370.1 pyroglutamyl-peptidase I [Actinotignum timonense]
MTYFEPFGSDTENASRDAALRSIPHLRDMDLSCEVEVATAMLPVVFASAGLVLDEAVERFHPDAVIAIGEAGGRSAITPELQAFNENIARIPDNAGAQPDGEPVIPGGPAIATSPVRVVDITRAISGTGISAETSRDPGRYLCNNIAYRVAQLPVPGLFIHVPALRTVGVATVGAETDAPSAAVSQPAPQPAPRPKTAHAAPSVEATAPSAETAAPALSRPATTFDELGRGIAAAIAELARQVAEKL